MFALAPPEGSPSRDEAFPRFLDRAYDVFVDCFYYAQGTAPEDGWDVPAIEDSTQPHYPIVLEFDDNIGKGRAIEKIANRLCEGSFREFAQCVLKRISRTFDGQEEA